MVSEFFFGASCGAGAFGASCGAEAALVFGAEEAEGAALFAFEPSVEDCSAFCSLLCATISKMRPKIAGKKRRSAAEVDEFLSCDDGAYNCECLDNVEDDGCCFQGFSFWSCMRCGNYCPARSFATSAPIAKPIAAGTKALLPGMLRRSRQVRSLLGGHTHPAAQPALPSSSDFTVGSGE